MNRQVKDGTAKTAPFVVDATDTVLSVEFLDPQIKPRKGPLAARGAAALALAAINSLLAIIPFVDPGGDPEGGCQPQKRYFPLRPRAGIRVTTVCSAP